MPSSDVEVVVIGGGAAGVAAAKRLHSASIRCLLVEARPRLGGRAWTVHDESGHALDLGCGWLHSADRNPWVGVAQAEGLTVDRTPPPWMNRPLERSFPRAELIDFRKAFNEFYDRLHDAAQRRRRCAGVDLLDPSSRWNPLMNATSTYISGAALDRISLKDLDRYHSTDVNWRAVEGYGTLISKHGAALPQMLDCPVSAVDHGGKRLRIETSKGAIAADRAIVTVPTSVLAAERISFTPALPQKIEAARGLPLGVDDKLFIALAGAEEFDTSVRVYGRTDRVGTAGYHLRPFGWPIIECYFGGDCAAELEKGGRRCVLRFCRVRAHRRVRQRFRPPAQTDPCALLARRSLRARRIFLCIAGQRRLPGGARRAGRRPAVLCRRSLFAARFLDRAWRLSHRRCGGRAGDRRAQS